MSFELVFKVAGVGLVVAILAIILDAVDKKEIAKIVTIAGVVVVFYMVIQGFSELFVLVQDVFKLY